MTHQVRLLTMIATLGFASACAPVGCEVQNQDTQEKTTPSVQVTEVETQIVLPIKVTPPSPDKMKSLNNVAKLSSSSASFDSMLIKPDGPAARLVPDSQQIKEQVVVLEPISLDLGSFSTSEKGVGNVTLTNTGAEPVTIISAKASCGCTTSDFKNNTVLAAGESTNVTVTMNGKGRARKLSKTVTFNVAGYPSLKLPVLAESIAFVSLDVERLIINEETGTSTITLTSKDGKPFRVLSMLPAIAGDMPTAAAPTVQLNLDWNLFWDVVKTTKVTIRLDHPLCTEITTSVRMSSEQRRKLNEAIRFQREGGDSISKDKSTPVSGDQMTRYIKSGRGGQVLEFIKEGRGSFNAVDPNKVPLLSTAAQVGDASTVLGLLELGAQVEQVDGINRTPLMYAAMSKSKDPDLIRIFVEAGADIQARDQLGYSTLAWASFMSSSEVVQALIDEGADTNTVDIVTGYTPLLWAAGFGDTKSVPILIEAGADVNIFDSVEGRTPLMYAVRTGTPIGVSTLIAAGATVNAIDNSGMTALHIGADNKNVTLDKLKLLVEAGVNVSAKDEDGLTALDYAKTRTDDNASSVVNYLSQHSKSN